MSWVSLLHSEVTRILLFSSLLIHSNTIMVVVMVPAAAGSHSSAPHFDNAIIQTVKLRGHSASVLCLDHSSSLAESDFSPSPSLSCDSYHHHQHQHVGGSSASALLSGSEDGTCRLWDLRAPPHRAVLCIQCPAQAAAIPADDSYSNTDTHNNNNNSNNNNTVYYDRSVLSVAFGPQWLESTTETNPTNTEGEDVELQQSAAHSSTASSFTSSFLLAREFCVFTSIGNNVYGYDLRRTSNTNNNTSSSSSPIVILREPSMTIGLPTTNDEINQIAWCLSPPPHQHKKKNPKSKQQQSQQTNSNSNTYNNSRGLSLAVADDSGTISVVDECLDWYIRGSHGQGTTAPTPTPISTATASQYDSNNSNRNHRTYCHGSESMVTSIAYCPSRATAAATSAHGRRSSSHHHRLLASGGTDCCIKLWDTSKQQTEATTTRQSSCLCSVSMIVPVVDDDATALTTTNTTATTTYMNNSNNAAPKLYNPPMVHSLNWSPSGSKLAAGLGDGSVALLSLRRRQSPSIAAATGCLSLTDRMHNAHSGPVASCLFPQWTPSSMGCQSHNNNNNNRNYSGTAHDRLLCTSGNDGNIVLWDLGAVVGGDKAIDPRHVLRLSSSSTTFDSHHDSSKKFERLSLQEDRLDDDYSQPKALYAFRNSAKPNWMVSSRGNDASFPSALFVADTTCDITVYQIPLQ